MMDEWRAFLEAKELICFLGNKSFDRPPKRQNGDEINLELSMLNLKEGKKKRS